MGVEEKPEPPSSKGAAPVDYTLFSASPKSGGKFILKQHESMLLTSGFCNGFLLLLEAAGTILQRFLRR